MSEQMKDLSGLTFCFWRTNDIEFTMSGAFVANHHSGMARYNIEVGDRVELAKLQIVTSRKTFVIGELYYCPEKCSREQLQRTLTYLESKYEKLHPGGIGRLMQAGVKELVTDDFNFKRKNEMRARKAA